MAKYRIVYDRNNCIGAATCEALDPDHFKLVDDGKADLLGGSEKDGKWVLETDDLKEAIGAAQGCPAKVIEVYDETGKRLDE